MLRRQPGFTLIETLLYTLFVGMIITGMTLLTYSAFTVRGKLRATLILEENLRFATNRISSLVSNASSTVTPTIGNTSSTLVLTMPTPTNSTTTVWLTNGTIFMTEGTSTAVALTSNEVSLSSLLFTRANTTSTIVRIVASGGMRSDSALYSTLTATATAAIRR